MDDRDAPFALWIMTGVDLAIDARWRGLVRIGHLGDIDSRIVLAESAFVARQDFQMIAGYAFITPTASGTPTSLFRAGATWLPIRRRLAVENRLWVEHRRTTTASSFRLRDRVRLLYSRPGGLPFSVFGSIEPIAAEGRGVVEHRIQLGATRSIHRAGVEGYWLQRRFPRSVVVNGFGLTASWRIGR